MFYIWVGILGVLAPTQVWTLANYLLTTREAKRVFGLVGAGGITGWIFSGLLAEPLARTKGLGTESLLLVMAIAARRSAPCSSWLLWREREAAQPPAGAVPHAEPHARRACGESLAVVFSSPYLMSIASLITLASLATCFAGWQFKAIAKAAYSDKNALTAFFGRFNFWAGLACLVLQLLLTSRFLRRFGLGPALLVVPLRLFCSEIGVLALGTLGAAILLKGGDSVVRYSLDKSSVELLYLPIPPRDSKLQAKSTIDTVIWRLGDGLAGFTLAIFTDRLHWSAQRVSLVNLVFVGGWIAAAIVARRRYGGTLLESIRSRRLDAERQLAPVLDRSTADILAGQLESPDPKRGALRARGLRRLAAAASPTRACATCSSTRSPPCAGAPSSCSTPPATSGRFRASRRCFAIPTAACVRRLCCSSPTTRRSIPLTRIQELDGFQDVSVLSGIVAFLARSGDGERLPEARLADGSA